MRHVAASIVVLTDGKEMRQACVDVQGEEVTAIRPLTHETPFAGGSVAPSSYAKKMVSLWHIAMVKS